MSKTLDVRPLLLGMLLAGFAWASVPSAQASTLMSTDTLMQESFSSEVRDRLMAEMSRDAVAGQLAAWGVSSSDVQARLAQLSEAELQTLAARLDDAPAGAGALEVIGVVFLVLLILELVGVIDIFKSI